MLRFVMETTSKFLYRNCEESNYNNYWLTCLSEKFSYLTSPFLIFLKMYSVSSLSLDGTLSLQRQVWGLLQLLKLYLILPGEQAGPLRVCSAIPHKASSLSALLIHSSSGSSGSCWHQKPWRYILWQRWQGRNEDFQRPKKSNFI